jgi:hypothetical protein
MEILSYDRKEGTDFQKQTSVSVTTMLNDSENINIDIQSGLIKEAVCRE